MPTTVSGTIMSDLTLDSEKQHTDLSLEYGTPENPGYHTLASIIGKNSEYAVFRKFSSLNAINLMSLQAELLELEHQYKLMILKNEKDENGIAVATCFKALHSSKSQQKKLLNKIGSKLDAYSKSQWLILCQFGK